ncbi:hypothetical protein [Piscirickettsia salmonis]|uniref:Uncharacterized protein n=1 Tax=Piscirickettsia salmonis TaxID=1238 RepID=A0A9Q5V7P9_PISSA|nr:hypothetical protein [Piscirickettsia salmonis]APS58900.1 hypothetical protein AVI52_16810 [Piscirickettsia salmonis]ERL60652.1 hypothetical protein K661_03030 [Piscirickettsia salmonis LF-89 = ATCC VR-1361]PEQ15141.1 hypothetical protein X973_14365 [Piscirickettsia salmonis]QGN79203.1 hypothetical protein Psal001_03468 [Piscirickettsia salmonis]QGN82794.1 hypothetical protein Psal002_03494 [Piscirickettsia salmonis]
MILTAEQLEIIEMVLKKQLQNDPDYLFNHINLTVSQNTAEELEVTIQQRRPVITNIAHPAIERIMGINNSDPMDAGRKEYDENFTKKPRENRSEVERCKETIIYTPAYTAKIFLQCRSTLLHQRGTTSLFSDHQANISPERTTSVDNESCSVL